MGHRLVDVDKGARRGVCETCGPEAAHTADLATIERLTAQLAAMTAERDEARRVALEEAARVCEGRAESHTGTGEKGAWDGWTIAKGEARKCANQIRSRIAALAGEKEA